MPTTIATYTLVTTAANQKRTTANTTLKIRSMAPSFVFIVLCVVTVNTFSIALLFTGMNIAFKRQYFQKENAPLREHSGAVKIYKNFLD